MQYYSRLRRYLSLMSGPFPITSLDQANNPCSTVQARGNLYLMRPDSFNSLDQTNNPHSTFQALRGICFDETEPTSHCTIQASVGHLFLMRPRSSITSLDQQSLSQAWIELYLVINPYNLALLPTASIDKAFLVIVMQFSIAE